MGLKVVDLKKSFNNKVVVDCVSFEMNMPHALGLVGLNGAGKTTTIRMIIDILKKDSGEVLWNDKPLTKDLLKIGYLPEERGIYPKVKVSEQLIYFAKLKGLSEAEAQDALNMWADKIDIKDLLDKNAEELSKGNQQKVQILTALIHDPDLIILDEPLSGLDPVNAELIKDILEEMIKKGKYIIFTSHQMNVIEEFCTNVVMLKEGKVVLSGSLDEIKENYIKNILLIKGDEELYNFLIDKYKNRARINEDNELELKIENACETRDILKDILDNNYMILKFELKVPTLREIFIKKAGEYNEEL